MAREVRVDVPGGQAGAVAIELASQTGTSIVIADPAVARRKVGAIKGTMSAQEAVRRLAMQAQARAVAISRGAWRIVAVAAPPRSRRAAVRPEAVRTAPPPRPVAEPTSGPIIVVASKRNLTLDRLAGQAAVLDGGELESGGLGGTEKITQRLSTVASTHLGSGRNKLFIRGIADSSFTGSTQATVGQYFGDLRLSYNSPDPDLMLADVERVEVLEGPQGTLYGAGSLGGIIRVVPRMPSMGEFAGLAQVGGSLTQSGEPGTDAAATINLPVAEDLVALRLTGYGTLQGGYVDKPVLGRDNVNEVEIFGGRAILRLKPAPDLTFDLVGFGQWTTAHDSQYADRASQRLESNSPFREGAGADYLQLQGVTTLALGEVEVKSSTGVTWQQLAERYDATLPGTPFRLFQQENDTRLLAHETRIWRQSPGEIGWLLGLSYTRNTTLLKRSFITDGFESSATGVRNRIKELTFYGEASLPLVDRLSATFGGRYTRSWLGGEGEDVEQVLALAGAAVTASRRESRFLPSASLLANLAGRTTLYLRYQQGFRPGGLAIEGDFVRRFESDHTDTYEFGLRHGQPGSGPVDLAASFSYTDWQNIQADFIDSGGLPSSANIGDGNVWSASISSGVEIVPDLRLEASMTWNKSRVTRPDVSALLPAASGLAPMEQFAIYFSRTQQVPNIAEFSGRMGLAWRGDFDNARTFEFRAWVSYVGKSRLGIGPELGELQGDYLDSGTTLRIGDDRLGVTLGMTNIANSRGNRFSLGTPFSVGREQVTPLRPRTLRIGVDANF